MEFFFFFCKLDMLTHIWTFIIGITTSLTHIVCVTFILLQLKSTLNDYLSNFSCHIFYSQSCFFFFYISFSRKCPTCDLNLGLMSPLPTRPRQLDISIFCKMCYLVKRLRQSMLTVSEMFIWANVTTSSDIFQRLISSTKTVLYNYCSWQHMRFASPLIIINIRLFLKV